MGSGKRIVVYGVLVAVCLCILAVAIWLFLLASAGGDTKAHMWRNHQIVRFPKFLKRADTFVGVVNGKTETIRILGIRAPAQGEPGLALHSRLSEKTARGKKYHRHETRALIKPQITQINKINFDW